LAQKRGYFSFSGIPFRIEKSQDSDAGRTLPQDGAATAFFRALGPLSFSANCIAASTGGTIGFLLNGGAANAGRTYFIAGSVTGIEPGMHFKGGVHLPLNWDAFSDVVLNQVNTPPFKNFMGSLDGNDKAQAELNTLGPVPQAAGLLMNFAYVLDNPLDYASNGGYIEILP
jgi:hypothetical protein